MSNNIPHHTQQNIKKHKFIPFDITLQIDSKPNIHKTSRFDVQSPKGMVGPLKDGIKE